MRRFNLNIYPAIIDFFSSKHGEQKPWEETSLVGWLVGFQKLFYERFSLLFSGPSHICTILSDYAFVRYNLLLS